MTVIELIDLHPPPVSLLEEALSGLLSSPQKTLPPKLFYDDSGSGLFDEITQLDEYYLTRVETSILEENAATIVSHFGPDPTIIELGSGSSIKTRILLDAISGPLSYMPVDISRDHLLASAEALARAYPSARVTAVCADYTSRLELPDTAGKRVVFFPGSTVGNFDLDEAASFFTAMKENNLRKGDLILIGYDLIKDPAVLNAAYNDARGVTADFNLNLLLRINKDLGADFDVSAFAHEAFYSEAKGRIEMHLRSLREQTVHLGGRAIHFEEGETIHTENSYKYSVPQFESLLAGAGLKPAQLWQDKGKMFAVELFTA